MRSNYLFTSESVSEGHPDKVADQISDAIVDLFLSKDPEARIACETLTTTQLVVLAGEIRGKGEEVEGGVGPYLYSINDGKSFVSQIEFQNITPGTYNLWIQDANGCEFHKKLVVPPAPDPAISIDPEFNIQLGDSLQLKAVLAPGYPLALIDSVVWTPLDGLTFTGTDIFSLLKPIAKPFKPTEYTVTVYSLDGCQASDRVLIRVDNEPHIYIPNAFSPWHEDGKNDVVYISADNDQIVQITSFQIFDRWGSMVFRDFNFQPNDPKHGWDGFRDGKIMDPAVFVYYAEIELIDGRKLLYKGDVTLVW